MDPRVLPAAYKIYRKRQPTDSYLYVRSNQIVVKLQPGVRNVLQLRNGGATESSLRTHLQKSLFVPEVSGRLAN